MREPGDATECPSLPGTAAANPALVAGGWELRFMADPPRCAEALELYRQLGFEVRAEPVSPEQLGPDCEGCQVVVYRSYSLLYTRRPAR